MSSTVASAQVRVRATAAVRGSSPGKATTCSTLAYYTLLHDGTGVIVLGVG